MNREILVRVFFFAAFLFLLFQVYTVLSSFLKPIAWSILLAIVFRPIHLWVLQRTRGRRAVAALLVTLAIVLLVALPATALSGVLATEAASLMQELSNLSDSGAFGQLYDRVATSGPGRLVRQYVPWIATLNLDVATMARAGAPA
jgi:predicted PurR-regulated permease PerM